MKNYFKNIPSGSSALIAPKNYPSLNPGQPAIFVKQKSPKLKFKLIAPLYYDTNIKLKKAITLGPISLKTTGRLHLYNGYQWNGANCFPDISQIIRASAVHDALYELIITNNLHPKYKTIADAILTNICEQDNMPRIFLPAIFSAVYLLQLKRIKKLWG